MNALILKDLNPTVHWKGKNLGVKHTLQQERKVIFFIAFHHWGMNKIFFEKLS
jgi:hypothetical protein